MAEHRVMVAEDVAGKIKSAGGDARRAFARTLDEVDWDRDATVIGAGYSSVYKDGALIIFRRGAGPDNPVLILEYRRDEETAAA